MNEKDISRTSAFAVIFDMDGVLIDSTTHIWESFNRLMEQKGVIFDRDSIKKYLGMSLRDQIAMWKGDYGVDAGDPAIFSADAFKIQMELMSADAYNNGNLLTLLQRLRNEKVSMGVGTSSRRYRAEEMLSSARISEYFEALVTAEDVSEHKPDPHTFLEVAKRMNVAPKNCVVIEDAKTGIQAARNAGMKSIGFLTEWNDEGEFIEADLVIRDFSELSFEILSDMFI